MKKVLMTATVASMIGQFNMSNIHVLLDLQYEVHVAVNFREYSCWSKERVKEFVSELKALGVKPHQIDYSRSPRDIRKIGKSFQQMERLLKTEKFVFVHCHTPVAGVISRICCHKYGIKVVYTAHGFHFYKGAPWKNWLLYFPVEWLCSWMTDVLIVINKEDYIRAKKCLHAEEIEYVPGAGIDIKKFSAVTIDNEKKREELGLKPGDIMLLSVGELSARKNHAIVVEAISRIANPRIHYYIAGMGALKVKIGELGERFGVSSQIHLMGYRNDISELCQVCDLFVFPSHQEGLPMALMEAVAGKKRVVCSWIRGNTDIIRDRRCLFDESSVADVVEKIRRILDISDGEATTIINKNLLCLEKYDLRNVVRMMKNLYKRAQ